MGRTYRVAFVTDFKITQNRQNRTMLNRTILTVLIISALVGCAPSKQNKVSQAEVDRAIESEVRKVIACGRENVSAIDDNRSDAYTVAIALSGRCSVEYKASIDVVLIYLDNDDQRRMFRDRRNTQRARAETFLPVVMEYRNSKK